ncbi:hypothetical protein [Chroococcidiopsis sp. TS-821]|uniref:hypothetical protein n=1 Tax=Chroococcidiopsis sp. TS-821 TaxID=1378066 RepID=UPI000CEF4C65|nr:hypothetical protein [Chroococcidiopsis sp. TS-821]PPS45757.1 hypothetical protein B1A85_05810 [Chroococcidiopsis sp. TS-821]
MKNYLQTLLHIAIVIALLVAAFPWLYEMKSKAGIDIIPEVHAGTVIEKYTNGIVKCEWLYPYYCHSDRAKNA